MENKGLKRTQTDEGHMIPIGDGGYTTITDWYEFIGTLNDDLSQELFQTHHAVA